MPQARDLARLPKAALHLHLEGAMRPETLIELCEKYRIPVPDNITCTDTNDNPSPKRFTDFSAFVDVYVAACACLQMKEDVHRLVLEVAQDLKTCNVLFAEIAPSFTFYSQYFGSMENTLKVLVDAAPEYLKREGIKGVDEWLSR